ncbi:MAG: hypothetical protein OXU69_10795 [Gemmatimonadota bacterium]|nr:hypothetical protein [Gemmatimonadota bacterium]MDE2985183.1 hypothetical protein [Gemmatimonadota bacterium]
MSKRNGVRFATLAAAVVLDVLFFRPIGDPAVAPGFLSFAHGDFAAAMALQESHNQDLLGIPGVAGTAVGIGMNGLPVVKVYLAHTRVLGLPASLDGHEFVTEVTGRFHALGDMPSSAEDGGGPAAARSGDDTDPRRSFPRPVPIGVSTGQVDVTAGTIAARVVSGEDVFALSNNHVYANRNAANLGDRILQPGTVDGGVNPDDAIGTLHDYEPIRFCAPFPTCPSNRIDAAIAATSTDQLGNSTPSNGYGTPRSTTTAARLGMEVQKYGRTTGHTTGKITGINATLNVGFRDGTARFVGQIMISGGGFSGPGDSGSLIVSGGSGANARQPVGLLFAGSQSSTVANPIDVVLKRFDVTIDGS